LAFSHYYYAIFSFAIDISEPPHYLLIFTLRFRFHIIDFHFASFASAAAIFSCHSSSLSCQRLPDYASRSPPPILSPPASFRLPIFITPPRAIADFMIFLTPHYRFDIHFADRHAASHFHRYFLHCRWLSPFSPLRCLFSHFSLFSSSFQRFYYFFVFF